MEQLEADKEKITGQRVEFGSERTALLELIDKLTNQMERMRSLTAVITQDIFDFGIGGKI